MREIADAGGVGLVDASGLTLYLFDGDATHGNPVCSAGDCASRWTPLEAPAIANPVGHFSTIARDDGITQWAYQGKPLYKFNGDRQPGDVNGAGVDSRFRVALTLRFFMPAGVTIRRHIELGNILATDRGATLYQRDRVTMQELHPFRIDHGSPALGRALGTATCDADLRENLAAVGGACGCAAPRDIGTSSPGRTAPGSGRTRVLRCTPTRRISRGTSAATASTRWRRSAAADIAAAANPFVGGAASGLGVSALFWHAVVP